MNALFALPKNLRRAPEPYPFLAAAYSVLAMAVYNSAEVIRWSDLLWPFLTVTVWVLWAFLFGRVLTGSSRRASLVALLALLLFSTYGYIAGGFYLTFGHETAIRWEPVLLVMLATALGAAAYLLRLRRSSLTVVSRVLNVFFGLLVSYNLAVFIWEYARPSADDVARMPLTRVEVRATARLPDIYLIIPDKYTGSAVLAAHLGFDNQPMDSALRARGFVVPAQARANYPHTFLALASMLNLRYLDDFPERFGVRNTRWRDAYSTIEHNETVRLLRSHGYRYVFVPTAFGATRQSSHADLQIPHPSEIKPEFAIAWRRTTLLPFLHRMACAVAGCDVGYFPYVPEAASLTDWKFRELERLSDPVTPTFVLAHLAVPHEPYMYGPHCEHRKPFWPPADSAEYGPKVSSAYLDQISCVNRKLLRLVDAIRRRAAVPPVILIQSDHGHGRVGRWVPELADATPEQVTERLSVFAAYFIPGLSEAVPDTITPINAMRMALRYAVGARLPPLPDMSYWSSRLYAYNLVRVR